MPKRLLKRYLPSPEKLREHNIVRRLAPWIGHHNLWHLNRRSVAGGIAVGMFTGLIPGPFQMFVAALVAIGLRVNLPVAMMTTLYTNPFTLIPIYIVAYKIGAFATGHASGPLPHFDFALGERGWLSMATDFMRWIGSLGHEFFIGLFILACLLSFFSYFAVRGLWRLHATLQWRKRKKRFSRAQ